MAAPAHPTAVALVVVVHPPKFADARAFLHAAKSVTRVGHAGRPCPASGALPPTVYLVFSNARDRDAFRDGATQGEEYQEIVLPDGVDLSPSPVTLKKFHALRFLASAFASGSVAHEYVVACDAELAPLPAYSDAGLCAKIRAAFDARRLYAGRHTGLSCDVYGSSVEAFAPGPDRDRVSEVAERLFVAPGLYAWWSDLPAYEVRTLDDFLGRLGAVTRTSQFDHAIYQLYLVAFRGFRVVDATSAVRDPNLASLEGLRTSDESRLEALEALGFGFGWVWARQHEAAPAFCDSRGACLAYHLDR